MLKRSATLGIVITVAAMALATGCTGISVQPSCPADLRVGESGELDANELNPGQIATYQWEVSPADAGTISSPNTPTTTFQAAKAGPVTYRITATDGLYLVTSACNAEILSSAVAVSFEADPPAAEVGETVTLTCSSSGSVVATSFEIIQVDGQVVELEQDSNTATFSANVADERTFRCVGSAVSGGLSDAVYVVVAVTGDPIVSDDNSNDNSSDNENDNVADNGNENDNTTDDNENDNTDRGRVPDDGGRANVR